jgi:hypothetical protein
MHKNGQNMPELLIVPVIINVLHILIGMNVITFVSAGDIIEKFGFVHKN